MLFSVCSQYHNYSPAVSSLQLRIEGVPDLWQLFVQNLDSSVVLMEHVWKPQQKENCILGDPKTRLIWHLNNFPRTQTCALMFFLKGCILIHDKTQQLKKIPSNMQDEQILISSGLSSTECCSYHYWPRPCPLCNSPHKAIKYTARYFLFISELDVKVKNRKKINLKKKSH